jgi:hypothetical protein
VNHPLVTDDLQGLASGMEITPFTQSDHPVSPAPKFFCFGIGGIYSFMIQQ